MSWFRARDAQVTITPSFAFNSQNTYFRTHDLVNIKDRHLKHVSFELLIRGESKWKRILIHLRSWFRARDAQVTITPSFAFNSQNTYFRTHDLVNIKDRHLKLVSFETLLRVEAKLTRILIHLRSWFRARDARVLPLIHKITPWSGQLFRHLKHVYFEFLIRGEFKRES